MAVIVSVCVDPRLEHEVIRAQVRARLERMQLPNQLVYIVGDVGGNVSASFSNTAGLIVKNQDRVELAAILYHDDCVAARLGLRKLIGVNIEAARKALRELDVEAPILSGEIRSETSAISWSDEPPHRYEVLSFRMPRL
jgi:hypothetical protein